MAVLEWCCTMLENKHYALGILIFLSYAPDLHSSASDMLAIHEVLWKHEKVKFPEKISSNGTVGTHRLTGKRYEHYEPAAQSLA